MTALEKLKTERVVLYGAGLVGLGIANVLMDFGVNPVCFCDKKKTGIEPNTKLPLISPQRLHDEYADAVVVISTPIYAYQVEQNLKSLGFKEDKIISDLAHLFGDIPDDEYLKAWFKQTGYDLNLENPQTFNEKIQWIKLYDRKPVYVTMADKIAAKDFIREKLGTDEYLVPTLGVWEHFDEIDFDKLPDQFVLKCNHDCGGVVIVPDKSKFDKTAARNQLTASLNRNYFWGGREWTYKEIKPGIIAEEYLGGNVNDYKLFAFNGKVHAIQVDFDRFTNHRRNVYTPDWEYIPVSILYPTDPDYEVKKPKKLDTMIEIAEFLSKNIPLLRVDFYFVHDKVYLGELTFYHGSGVEAFVPQSYNKTFGDWIEIPINEKKGGQDEQ